MANVSEYESFRQFILHIARHWGSLVFGLLFTITGAVNEWLDWQTPKEVWVVLAIGAFLIAIFRAFHDVRVDRDRLQDRLRPKLSIAYQEETAPFFEEQLLFSGEQQFRDRRFRIGIKNESDVVIQDARVVLESCEPTQEGVHLEHSFAVMGQMPNSGRFDLAPGDVPTAYVDVVCEQIPDVLVYGQWYFCYAAQVSNTISRMQFTITLRAEGGGTYARKTFVIEPDPETLKLRMKEKLA